MSQSQVRMTTFKMYDGFGVKMTWTSPSTQSSAQPHFSFSHRKSPQLQGTYTGINMGLLPATNTGKNLKLHHNSMYLTLMKCHNINLNIPLVKSRFVVKLYFKKLVLNEHYLQLKSYVVTYLKHVIKCPLPQN